MSSTSTPSTSTQSTTTPSTSTPSTSSRRWVGREGGQHDHLSPQYTPPVRSIPTTGLENISQSLNEAG